MRILSLEISGRGGSIGLLEDDTLRAQRFLDPTEPTTRVLAPALQEILQQVSWTPRDIQLVGVSTGPGSFTGLRLGVITAKTFAYVTRAALVGVPTLQVIVEQVPAGIDHVWTVLDAQRGELFAARWQRNSGTPWQEDVTTHIVSAKAWLEQWRAEPVPASGTGLIRISAQLPPELPVLARDCWAPRAETLGRVALARLRAGGEDDPFTLLPHYYRLSAAEEKHR